MKQNDSIEKMFEGLKGSFDLENPPEGHRERFLDRLDAPEKSSGASGGRSWWRQLSVAATIALLLSASVFLFRSEPSLSEPSLQEQVAEISPEASETSRYFAGLVSRQVTQLQEMSSPETQPLIEDALRQLEQLDADYMKMERDLVAGGNSKMILSAMIQNFQTRIDLLEEVMLRVEEVKQFKNENHETNTI